MALMLSDGVHAVAVRDDIVLLDINADAYFCLAGAADAVKLSAQDTRVTGDKLTLAQLREAGLLKEGEMGAPRRQIAAPLDANLRRGWRSLAKPSPGRLCQVLASGWRAREDVRRLGLLQLLRRAEAAPVGARRLLDLAQSTATFERLRPWAPFDGECLFRSYWQLLFLKALGHAEVRWVFGVRTYPFFAHCWLQAGEMVLNDDPDTLVGYQRILVI